MEDNSNLSGSTTSETDGVGGNHEEVSDLVEVFGNEDSGDIGISSAVNNSISLVLTADQYGQQSGTRSRSVWSTVWYSQSISMVNSLVLAVDQYGECIWREYR